MRSAAAAAAKSLQSCLTLCDPIDGSPPGSAIPGTLQARTLEWVAIASSVNEVKWIQISWLLTPPANSELPLLRSEYLCPPQNVEKAMATHSSTLAWKIPWTEGPGRLQSMGSRRVGHDWVTSFSLFTFMHWRRKWQPTPVFLSGESQGRRSLMGCRLWVLTDSDTTDAT